jgi:GTP-binding protein HflX
MDSTTPQPPRALLISIRTPEIPEAEAAESLRELERLVTTLGFEVAGTAAQNRPNTNSATVVGSGKLLELAELTKEKATVAVFDCDLRPSQLRHVENALGVEVLDRTGVIIEIFSRHAKTRAARMQVEIARLNYLSPRLRETGSSGERQAGRGSGESALATERRAIRDRLAGLRRELAQLQAAQSGPRSLRSEQPCAALVGYTNAGKSSLMRALTGSEVLVQDKLFATLDTTVRALKPETQPRILLTDTVGFIRKLPHDLVASFRSTLEEALQAHLLLYVVDAADPAFRSQLEVVEEVLREVGVKDTPVLLVLNKADLLAEEEKRRLQREFAGAVQISTRRPEDVRALHARIQDFFEQEMAEAEIFVPYSQGALLGELRGKTRVLEEKHENEGTRFRVRARACELVLLKKKASL